MNGIDPVAVAGAAARRALDRRALGLRKENSHEPRGGPRPANPTYNKELLHFLSSSLYQQHTILYAVITFNQFHYLSQIPEKQLAYMY